MRTVGAPCLTGSGRPRASIFGALWVMRDQEVARGRPRSRCLDTGVLHRSKKDVAAGLEIKNRTGRGFGSCAKARCAMRGRGTGHSIDPGRLGLAHRQACEDVREYAQSIDGKKRRPDMIAGRHWQALAREIDYRPTDVKNRCRV